MEEWVYDFFKTFIDINRLRIAALLSHETLTIEELAQQTCLKAVEVQRHINQIEKLGILILTEERPPIDSIANIRQPMTPIRRYHLDAKAMEALSREVLAGRRPVVEARSNDENADDFDRQVVKNYSDPDGRLKELPSNQKKLMPILRHVVQVFTPGQQYTEKEVNIMLVQFYPDVPSLRRYLIDYQLLHREKNGSIYWREL